MKKVISLILVALVFSVSAFAATPGDRTSPGVGDVWGQKKFPSDPHRSFRKVRYVPASGTSVSATLTNDSIVVWDVVSDDGVTVTTTTTSPDSAVAGIIKNKALTPEALGRTARQDEGKRNWTWLQTYGLAEVRVNATNNVVVNAAMGTSATAGEADHFLPSTSDSTKQGKAGFFLDSASAAANDVECFLVLD